MSAWGEGVGAPVPGQGGEVGREEAGEPVPVGQWKFSRDTVETWAGWEGVIASREVFSYWAWRARQKPLLCVASLTPVLPLYTSPKVLRGQGPPSHPHLLWTPPSVWALLSQTVS